MKPRLCLTVLFILALCAACAPVQPGNAPAPTPILPSDGLGGIVGRVEQLPSGWQQPVQLYAAPFLDDGNGQGIYMLEPDTHPSVEIDSDGFFQVNDVPPGKYVLVAGPTPEEAHLLIDTQQQTEVVKVDAGQVLDLGVIQISE